MTSTEMEPDLYLMSEGGPIECRESKGDGEGCVCPHSPLRPGYRDFSTFLSLADPVSGIR